MPLLSARLTTAPAVCPVCASNALVCTLNSEIASDGGEKPTPRRVGHVGRAVDREFVAALRAVGDDASEVAVVGRAREVQVGRVHDAGRETRQHVGGAVAERQLRDLFGVDSRAADAALVLRSGASGDDRHRLLHPAGLQHDVDANDVADADACARR